MTANVFDDLSLGEFIVKKRELLGFKKIQFSKMMGVGDDTLRWWERDRFVPAGINRRNLIKILNFNDDDVIRYFGGEKKWAGRQITR